MLLYFVLCDYGAHGLAWAERAVDVMDFDSTVSDIRDGHLTGVRRILECSLEGPICYDRTEDVLKAAGKWSEPDAPLAGQDLIDWRVDHARDLRKHEVA